jgi:hypothetical protein
MMAMRPFNLKSICCFAASAVLLASLSYGVQVSYESLPKFKAPDKRKEGVQYCLLDDTHQTILGFTPLRDSLSDVKKRFKGAVEIRVDGYHHGRAVCISSTNKNDGTKVLFVKIPVADLYGIVLLSDEATIHSQNQCIPSAEVNRSIQTLSGIRLGMTKAEVVNIIGEPSTRDNNEFQYRFEIMKIFEKEWFEQYGRENKGEDPGSLYSSVRSDIKIEFLNDRLVSYSVSTTDTF